MQLDVNRVRTLFVAASMQPDAAARAAYLDRECGNDLQLRQRVDVLIDAFFHLQTQGVASPPDNVINGNRGAEVVEPPKELTLDMTTGTFQAASPQTSAQNDFQHSGATGNFFFRWPQQS